MIISNSFDGNEVKDNPFDSQKKKILLIEPPFYNLFGYERWHYPLTLTLIGTYLEEKGHDVKILDADKPTSNCRSLNRTEARDNYHSYKEIIKDETNHRWSEIREKIKEFNPDIIGITSISAKIDSANIIAKISKELFGDKVKIILGGPHAQGIRQMFPNYNFGPNYDYVITNIPSLVDRKPNKKLIINYDEYHPRNLSSILTSTGCPNSCTFCCNSFNRQIVYRSVQSIKEELKEIKEKFGNKEPLYILDDCFLSNEKRFREIGQIIKEYGFKFSASARITALTEEKIKDFINYGGQQVRIGVESGSQKVLDLVQKRIKISEIIKRTQLLNKNKLNWTAFFVIGFPFETLEDLKLTEELIYKIKPTFVSLNRFTPYPGTKIWQDYYLNKNLEFKDLFQLNPHNKIVKLSDEMEEYINNMFKEVDVYNKNKPR